MSELQTPATQPAPAADPLLLTITPKAVEMILATRDQEGIDASHALRIAVMGGGCSGFQFALNFDDETREGDIAQQYGDLTVRVDPISARYLDDVTIDFIDDHRGRGFKIDNPRNLGSCGCGSSYNA
ncbi:MAG TPA: iron-sulfur cluster assembly accessory protein [Thermoanaerobaculia bacterium]|jgi:iron-sulfur cluster assembly accessory protein|nr:iron-sulfur cluster assembly accessory protein [Acidobacteriota bacterium]OQC40749.1 MAG: Iron-sulfur cluster insertion protein ErpA [Acidobacteria bacterium ADurb.Bin051]HNU82027.1 iron-sulfur cluster assembly accessory protein [Thermoanaerobaculia bacterium]HPA96720.1 iron-sulfur cluster assembly accessory protein [Thermoanaerobaculia bacterium]HQN39428.1 iron-sulfur cluster assembly accessory protein [Thermoanaerobaculia bacterium]